MDQNQEKGQRIAKVIANSGFCSRRDAENLITSGRVKVNGKTIDSPATFITDHSIKIDNKLINSRQETKLFIFNKPDKTITSRKDEKNRPTVFDFIDETKMPRLLTIGRLDFNTEGLLLLTTNGDLARYIELPKTGWIRKYRARVYGRLDEKRLKKLEKGISIEGVRYGSIKVEIEKPKEDTKKLQSAANSWLSISLSEGKKREIRKVMTELGLQVNRLIRISYGPFNLKEVKSGEILEIPKKDLKNHLPKVFLD